MPHRESTRRTALLVGLAALTAFALGWWARGRHSVEAEFARLPGTDWRCAPESSRRDSLWRRLLSQAVPADGPSELEGVASLVVRREGGGVTVTGVTRPIDDEILAQGYRLHLRWDDAERRWRPTSCEVAYEREF